jgi:acyl-CoA synthetase (NDP forming)
VAEIRLNATLTGATVIGELAICSPSGAVGVGLHSHEAALGLGVSPFASLGNRADVSTNDSLEWCEQDRRTVAVILYVDKFGTIPIRRPAGSGWRSSQRGRASGAATCAEG